MRKKIGLLLISLCFFCAANIGAMAKTASSAAAKTTPKNGNKITAEEFYDYQVKTDDTGRQYVLLKGIREKYRENASEIMLKLSTSGENGSLTMCLPRQLEGIPVTEIGDRAFQNIPLGDEEPYRTYTLTLPSTLTSIGEQCFENCLLADVEFLLEDSSGAERSAPLILHDRAFASNPNLWGVYLGNIPTLLENEIFLGCAEKVYVCYLAESTPPVGSIAQGQVEVVEIPGYYSNTPLIQYPQTPLILKPEVKNFFYGDSPVDEELYASFEEYFSYWNDDRFCSFEYDDNAPDFGFFEWCLPCGEFCAMYEWKAEYTASSTLASSDGRYDAKYLYSGRRNAWAEGVEGDGIGESISLTQCCSYQLPKEEYTPSNVWFWEGSLEPDIYDGYIRYTQLCIANGYGKNKKLWEENGRVKRLLMYVEDQPYAYLELEDTIRPQYFSLPVNDIKAAQGVDVHFKFVIEEVYPGTKYQDTCLTGLVAEYMGRRGH